MANLEQQKLSVEKELKQKLEQEYQKRWQEKKDKLEAFCKEEGILIIAQPFIEKGIIKAEASFILKEA